MNVHRFIALGIVGLLTFQLNASAQTFNWDELPSFPDPIGVGGPFAGTDQGALIVAGGANFPDGAPWEDGVKVWYSDIHVLEPGADEWISEFELPHPLGYGVSIETSEGLYLIGGSNAGSIFDTVYVLSWDSASKQLAIKNGPSLPAPSAFHAGALIGNTIYVAAGHIELDATTLNHRFWALDLSLPEDQRTWESKTAWPGDARIKAVGFAQQDGQGASHFYLVSGEIPEKRPDGFHPLELPDRWVSLRSAYG